MKSNRHKQARRSEFKTPQCFWPDRESQQNLFSAGFERETHTSSFCYSAQTQGRYSFEPSECFLSSRVHRAVPRAQTLRPLVVGGQEMTAAKQSVFQSRVIRACPNPLIPFFAAANGERWMRGHPGVCSASSCNFY